MTTKRSEYKKKQRAKNPEHSNYLVKRSVARNFIKKLATMEDIQELESFIEERKNELSAES